MARRIGAQTVTIVARAADSDGDWVDSSRTVVPGCLVQPQSSTEGQAPNRAATSARFIIYGPSALAQARSSHQVETTGDIVGIDPSEVVRLSVDGQPAVWTARNGKVDHVELIAVRVTG